MSLNGKLAINSFSPVIHVTSKNSTAGNLKKLKCKKRKLKINVGDAIDSNVTPVYGKKEVTELVAPARYESKNPSIATVDESGTIVGVSAGKTVIYAYTQHGTRIAIRVTVKQVL